MSSVRSLSAGACLAAALFASSTAASDEQKIIRLEQDVRKLERIAQDQARQIEDLRRQLGNASAPSTHGDAPAADTAAKWLTLANWERVRSGVSELDVIGALGPPTQLRTGNDNARVLLYALEIGTSGFLSGSVTLKDRKVVEVQRPELR
jgi:hypothetical protein